MNYFSRQNNFIIYNAGSIDKLLYTNKKLFIL